MHKALQWFAVQYNELFYFYIVLSVRSVVEQH